MEGNRDQSSRALFFFPSTNSAAFSVLSRVCDCVVLATDENSAKLRSLGLVPLFQCNVPPSAAEQYHLFLCPRSAVLPPALIRPAVAEDCDDLMPIFEHQSQQLTQR